LQPGGKLDAVLEPAEEHVRVGDFPPLAIGDEPSTAEPAERLESSLRAHPRLLASPDELQRLNEELRLADTAGAELQVEVGAVGELHARPLDQPDHFLGDTRIDVALVNERGELLECRTAELEIAGRWAGPQEGGTLPQAAERLVVTFGRRKRVGDGPLRALWTQPEVDAPHRALGRGDFEVRREPARYARPVLMQGERFAAVGRNRRAVIGVVEIEQIDVRAGVELPASELAHAEHDEGRRLAARGDGRTIPGGDVVLCFSQRHLDRCVGQIGDLEVRRIDIRPFQGARQKLARGDAELLVLDPAPETGPHPLGVR
jgi:hypothetical protein